MKIYLISLLLTVLPFATVGVWLCYKSLRGGNSDGD